jgi:hypothetical protein
MIIMGRFIFGISLLFTLYASILFTRYKWLAYALSDDMHPTLERCRLWRACGISRHYYYYYYYYYYPCCRVFTAVPEMNDVFRVQKVGAIV